MGGILASSIGMNLFGTGFLPGATSHADKGRGEEGGVKSHRGQKGEKESKTVLPPS